MLYLEFVFWLSFIFVFYAYIGYPVILAALCRLFPQQRQTSGRSLSFPKVSFLIPAHNEESIIGQKIDNTLNLQYPNENLEIIIISDGSTDNTKNIALQYDKRIRFLELNERQGKAAALNLGMESADGEIVVFTDASIMLEPESLQNLISGFGDPQVGCISGEDHIQDGSGEGLYGRYELFLRNLESQFYSIVGASGSFYAQRKVLCRPFIEGMAPDFLSVLNTVEQGYTAMTEPSAKGTMTAIRSARGEFGRKTRTLVRGMSALFHKWILLNPFRFPAFSFILISHKICRWMVPFFLVLLVLVNVALVQNSLYLVILLFQVSFYLLGVCYLFKINILERLIIPKISMYFILVNTAIFVAWWNYLRGVRQEIWAPTRR